MPKTSPRRVVQLGVATALIALASGFALSLRSEATETVPLSDLSRRTHIHGLAVDWSDSSRLLIATHHGVFRTDANGVAQRISEVHDFMGFTAHPSDPNALYASGHPGTGGNLGFVVSRDQGKTWTQLSTGVGGPVDFHQITVSLADPKTIYGAYDGGLQMSRDSGKTWGLVGPAPEKLIDLAASAKSSDTLYAATERGLLVSRDGGKSWKPVLEGTPASVVEVTPEGTLYAFLVGRGLVQSEGETLEFTTVSNETGGVLLHLAVDPKSPKRIFAVAGRGRLLVSTDQGRTWSALGASNS